MIRLFRDPPDDDIDWSDAEDDYERMKQFHKALVQALRFYAEESHYDYDDDFPERINLVTTDAGARERPVLARYAHDNDGGERE